MIKKARIQRGLKQKDISACTGLSQGYISQLEKSHFTHSPTITQIVKLSLILDIDAKDLAGYFIDKEIEVFNNDMSKELIESRINTLINLKKLFNQGVISKNEFNSRKNKLLDII